MTIENVGIRKRQKEKIKNLLRFGDSINGFVQKAVDEKLKRTKKGIKIKITPSAIEKFEEMFNISLK